MEGQFFLLAAAAGLWILLEAMLFAQKIKPIRVFEKQMNEAGAFRNYLHLIFAIAPSLTYCLSIFLILDLAQIIHLSYLQIPLSVLKRSPNTLFLMEQGSLWCRLSPTFGAILLASGVSFLLHWHHVRDHIIPQFPRNQPRRVLTVLAMIGLILSLYSPATYFEISQHGIAKHSFLSEPAQFSWSEGKLIVIHPIVKESKHERSATFRYTVEVG